MNQIADQLRHVLSEIGETETALGLAVSGGGDSMAMLHLAQACAADLGLTLYVATVNHGLRPEASAEAEFVAKTCQTLGLSHNTLTWRDWSGQGNLQAEARTARYDLLAGWAKAQGISVIALAHTRDDQAETVLMRISRSAGVDGLSGMQQRRKDRGVIWLRPLLGTSRDALRQYLRDNDQGWCEDPSNEDRSFERIRTRDVLKTLAPLGIDATVLSDIALNMSAARQALWQQTAQAAQEIVDIDQGDVRIERAKFAALPAEIQRRLLAHALCWVTSTAYPPRGAKLLDFKAALLAGEVATLRGCLAATDAGKMRIMREYNAVKDCVAPLSHLWDARWRVFGPEIAQAEVRALGENGIKECPNWRDAGLPRNAVLASPSVWLGDKLLGAPMAANANDWRVVLAQTAESFANSMITH